MKSEFHIKIDGHNSECHHSIALLAPPLGPVELIIKQIKLLSNFIYISTGVQTLDSPRRPEGDTAELFISLVQIAI